MGYAINTSGILAPRNWITAKCQFDRAKPWRGYNDEDPRPLHDSLRRKKHMNVRMVGDSVAYRLYHTDVITFHSDESVTVRGYSTQSTNAFFSALAPPGLRACFTNPLGHLLLTLQPGGSEWRWPDYDAHLMPDGPVCMVRDGQTWRAHESTPFEKFEKSMLMHSEARRALKEYNYQEFVLWMKAVMKMTGKIPNSEESKNQFPRITELYGWGKPKWEEPTKFLNRTCEHIKRLIYKHKSCYKVEEFDSIPFGQVRNLIASQRRTWV